MQQLRWRRAGAGWWRPPPNFFLKIFAIILEFFRIFILPSAFLALGKGFTECPTKSTRQRLFCRLILCRVPFAECGTRQSLCRVYFGLYRVPTALGKAPVSSRHILKQWHFLTWCKFKTHFDFTGPSVRWKAWAGQVHNETMALSYLVQRKV